MSEGAVAATTNVGTGIYGKGSYGRSQSLERLASGLSPHALPLSVLAVFDELDSPSLAAALAPGRR